MRIKITTDGDGHIVTINHGLQDNGEVSVRYRTHHVPVIEIGDHGTVEIDLSRENEDDQVILRDPEGYRVHFHMATPPDREPAMQLPLGG